MALAAMVGEEAYETICHGGPDRGLLGERFFAAAAYGTTPGRSGVGRAARRFVTTPAGQGLSLARPAPRRPGPIAAEWACEIAAAVTAFGFKVVGCTTSFEQTSASVAVLNQMKCLRPEVITILGGANCEGEMAEGIASLGAEVDFIFSGEAEDSFPDFLRRVLAGETPSGRIIYGAPCLELDRLPTPRYSEFFEQRRRLLPESPTAPLDLSLSYESSRGCWWYQQHPCTFCGLNGRTGAFREKSAERVIAELRDLVDEHPSRRICMADNIMPYRYFRTLLPRLGVEIPNLRIHYEQRANLSLRQLLALRQAGVTEIQPGIEALSTSLLSRMNKGVTARQNLALLRYARSAQLRLKWGLLYAFPGDELQDYEETLRLLPLLHHLPPPSGVRPLRIDRFSLYFERPARYGIRNLRPLEAYRSVFPSAADIAKLAYHFTAEYPSESRQHPETIERLLAAADAWRNSWAGSIGPPNLEVRRLLPGVFLLVDTRRLPGTKEARFLNRDETSLLLVPRRFGGAAEIEWALDYKLGVVMDGWFVPLASAEPQILLEFEANQEAVGLTDQSPAADSAEVLPL